MKHLLAQWRTAAATVYYHASATPLTPGTVLTPGAQRGVNNFPERVTPGNRMVYLTDDLGEARGWAAFVARTLRTRTMYVYEVEAAVTPGAYRNEFVAPEARVVRLIQTLTAGQLDDAYDDWFGPVYRPGANTDAYGDWLGDPMGKTALPSWRPYQNERPFWAWHDVVIATDKAGRNRTFEVWVDGLPFTRAPSLGEARARVEARLGPLRWKMEKLPLETVVHYYFGPTTEFTDPTIIYWADRGEA